MSKTFSDEVESCKTNCKPQRTTMFDNLENSIEFDQFYLSESDAQVALAYLTEKAREVENEPCQIDSQILPSENGFQLKATFTFSCQAEVVIFQMRLR